jgi:hypothetical protein
VSGAVQRPTATHAAVHYLRQDIGLLERELALVTGAGVRTVRRWLAHDVGHAQQRHADALDDLRAIAAALEGYLKRRSISGWLRTRNQALNGGRPLELLALGEFEAVLAAVHGVVDDPSIHEWQRRSDPAAKPAKT